MNRLSASKCLPLYPISSSFPLLQNLFISLFLIYLYYLSEKFLSFPMKQIVCVVLGQVRPMPATVAGPQLRGAFLSITVPQRWHKLINYSAHSPWDKNSTI